MIYVNHSGCDERAELLHNRLVWITGRVSELTFPNEEGKKLTGDSPYVATEDDDEEEPNYGDAFFMCGTCNETLSHEYVQEHMIDTGEE